MVGKRLFEGVRFVHDRVAVVIHQVDFNISVVCGFDRKGNVAFVDHEERCCCVADTREGLGRNTVDLLREGKVCFPCPDRVDGQSRLSVGHESIGPDPTISGFGGCCRDVRVSSLDRDTQVFGINGDIGDVGVGLGDRKGIDPGRKFDGDTFVSGLGEGGAGCCCGSSNAACRDDQANEGQSQQKRLKCEGLSYREYIGWKNILEFGKNLLP